MQERRIEVACVSSGGDVELADAAREFVFEDAMQFGVHEPALKATVAEACNAQRAAKTASALILVTSSQHIATTSLANLEREQGSIEYHARAHKTLRAFFRFAPALLFGALTSLVSVLVPALSLLPFGRGGVRRRYQAQLIACAVVSLPATCS